MDLGDKIEVRFFCQQEEQGSVNVRHYDIVGKAGNGVTQEAIADAMGAKFADALKDLMTPLADYRGCGVRRISPLPLTIEALSAADSGVGTVAGDPLPGQVSGIITLTTLFAGKRFRGRFYAPFPGEADNTTNGRPSTAYVTRLAILMNLLDDNVIVTSGADSNTCMPVVRSRKFGLWTQVIECFARTRWATQRRRGNYGSPNISPL